MHTCTHAHTHAHTCSWKGKAFTEARDPAGLSHRQKLMLPGQSTEGTVLVVSCLSVAGRGQEGPRWVDGVRHLGYPAAYREWRFKWPWRLRGH